MSVPIIAFFNNKGGVGKTSLVYHLAWMYADQDWRVLAADLDPQANLTAAFLDEDRLEEVVFEDGQQADTIYESVRPLVRGIGDVADPSLEYIEIEEKGDAEEKDFRDPDLKYVENGTSFDNLALLAGDLSLSSFEDQLSDAWPRCADGDERAFRVESAFWRVMQGAAERHRADVVLMDLGPNLGSINRSALIATDYVVIPLAPDLFSLKGMRNLGPTIRRWRKEWTSRLEKNPAPDDLRLPEGKIEPVGYTVLQHSVRLDRPVKAYERWIADIPVFYRREILNQDATADVVVQDDPHCLAMLKHYRSLMPLAQEARKPMFKLKYADGAIGSHAKAARATYDDFESLAHEITKRTGIAAHHLAG
jgi:cellulose biosynthesis protein BcsQ